MPEDKYSHNLAIDEELDQIDQSNQAESQAAQIQELRRMLRDSQEELTDCRRRLSDFENQPSAFDIMQTVIPKLSDIIEETLEICEGDEDNEIKLEEIKSKIYRSFSKMARELDRKGIVLKMHRPGDDYDRIAVQESFTKQTANRELDGKIAVSRFGFAIPKIDKSVDETVILYKYSGNDSEVTNDMLEKAPDDDSKDIAPIAEPFVEPTLEEVKEESVEIITYEEIGFGACTENCNGNDLIIPIGKSGEQIYNLHFNCNSDNQGYMALGRQGSGKTSMLNALIINGSMKYSHQDLEFWVTDCKDNLLFCQYVNSGIPHIRGVYGEKNGLAAALNELEQRIAKRYELLSTEGNKACGRAFVNIAEYNEYLDKNSQASDRLNRIIFVMDDMQAMFIDGENAFDNEEIAKQISKLSKDGAPVGIYFFISTQDFSEKGASIFRDELFSKIGGKITFGLSRGALNESGFGQSFYSLYQSIDFLKVGEAYAMSQHEESPQKIKIAFSSESKFEDYFKTISEKSLHSKNIEEPKLEEPVKKDRYVIFNEDITIKTKSMFSSNYILIRKGIEYPISENPEIVKMSKSNAFALEGAIKTPPIATINNELFWCVTDRGKQDSDELFLEIASPVDGDMIYLVNEKIDKSFIRIITKEK